MTTTQRPPNILFILSDEHRYNLAGFAGDSLARTPNMDRLAARGVNFTNAYTPSPICIPARQAIAAGQLPIHCGCPGWFDLAAGYETYARVLRRYGYQTTACGKLHHSGGEDMMQGWSRRGYGDVNIDARWQTDVDETAAARFRVKPAPDPLNWRGGGKPTDKKEILTAAPHPDDAPPSFDEMTALSAEQVIRGYFGGEDKTGEGKSPLMLYVGFLEPHYPYVCRQTLFDYYYPRVPLPRNNEPFDHPFLGTCPWWDGPLVTGRDIDEDAVRRALATYYGMVEQLDMLIGRVLDALEAQGQNLDDWLIVYSSDHGDMTGEHALWEKQKFFEESVKVPFLMSYPNGGLAAGTTREENVNLCDLFATFCDAAHLDYDLSKQDSRSLLPLARGEETEWNDESVSQMFRDGLRACMIKQGALKYQYYGEEMPEVLFDLEADPAENINFAEDEKYADAMRDFRARVAELGFGPNANLESTSAGYNR